MNYGHHRTCCLRREAVIVGLTLGLAGLMQCGSAPAAEVPSGFVDELVFDGAEVDIQGLYGLKFSPDGRMFCSEWRRGWIRVVTRDESTGEWSLLAEPFHRFATPDSNPRGETARRGTLRCFDFDPDFETNGIIYATYMHDSDRRGYRIVRIKASRDNPDQSDGSEQQLFVCPFFADGDQPDAHNGGGLVVGGDGKLYVSFGDGWREEAATDLRGFAGKIVRLNLDGSIPHDNVWYDVLEGDLRAIVAVGQRNPTCLSRHPVSGEIYINGFTGEAKAGMFRLIQGAHYGHGGSCELGERVPEWINTRMANGGTTWACWYPAGGTWPEQYWNNALAVNWMPNSGEIVRIRGSEQHPEKTSFAGELVYLGGDGVKIGPVAAEIGPDGHLYYTVREYGEYTDLRRIRYRNQRNNHRANASRRPLAPARAVEDPAISLEDLMRDEQEWLSLALADGNAQRGRRIFFENDGLACLKCHRWGEAGGEVGPPLTDIGARRSRQQVLESILFPNREIEKAYVQEIIATEEGQIVTGRIVDDANDHLVLLTADNRRVTVPKSSIELRRPGPSAMPDDFARRLTLSELRDLVEFLAHD